MLDDWTPAPPCETLVAMLQRSGADARITCTGLPPWVRFHPAGAAGAPAERVVYGAGQRGATVGPNPAAAQRARDNVRRELEELLAPS